MQKEKSKERQTEMIEEKKLVKQKDRHVVEQRNKREKKNK